VPADLAALLADAGLVSAEGLERARARQGEAGGALDTALLELGLVREDALAPLLERATGLPPAPDGIVAPDPRARRVFPARVAERHGLAPYRLEERELSVLATYPVDLAVVDEISFMLSLDLVPHVAPEWRVRELMARVYGTALPERFARVREMVEAAVSAATPSEVLPSPQPAAAPSPRPWAGEGDRPPTSEDPSSTSCPSASSSLSSDLSRSPPASPEPSDDVDITVDDEPPPAPAAHEEPLAAALAQVAAEQAAPRAVEPPAPALQDEPPRWTREEAFAALEAARRRDEVVAVALRYARDFFEAAALFAITRDRIAGHEAVGWPTARARCRSVQVPLGSVGLFQIVVETSGPYLGPVAREPGNERLLAALGRPWPRIALLYPVTLRDRTVCLLYADNGEAPVSPRRLGDLLLLAGALAGAFERILRAAKRAREGAAPVAAAEEGGWLALEPARAADPPPPADEVAAPGPPTEPPPDEYEIALASAALGAPRAFEPGEAVRRFAATARGSAQRGRLLAQLVQHGPDAAAALASAFPGPVDPLAAGEAVPPVEERGPVLTAMAALGMVATPFLVALLGDPDPARRRHAAALLGRIGDAAAFLPLADRTLDADAAVAEAAREALAACREHPDFRPVLERLRRALLGADGDDAAAGAAAALARAGDTEAVPLLLQALESPEPLRGAAADALAALTGKAFGPDARAWLAWWREHRGLG
jgi:HEAT repeat protein